MAPTPTEDPFSPRVLWCLTEARRAAHHAAAGRAYQDLTANFEEYLDLDRKADDIDSLRVTYLERCEEIRREYCAAPARIRREFERLEADLRHMDEAAAYAEVSRVLDGLRAQGGGVSVQVAVDQMLSLNAELRGVP